MVALDFKDAVFERAARATAPFQLAEQEVQGIVRQGQTGDERDGLAFPAFRIAFDAHRAVPGRAGCLFTGAVVDRLAAIGTDAPGLAGVDGWGLVAHRRTKLKTEQPVFGSLVLVEHAELSAAVGFHDKFGEAALADQLGGEYGGGDDAVI